MGRQQSPSEEHWFLSLSGYLLGVKGLVVKGWDAFVPSKNLQVRGHEVWTEKDEAGRASEKKHKLLQISRVPHSNAQLLPRCSHGSAPCSKEVSGWICAPC